MEHEKDGNAGRSGDLLAQAHMELQQRGGEMRQLQQEIGTLREEVRCSESARNAACQQILQLTSDMEKMALVWPTVRCTYHHLHSETCAFTDSLRLPIAYGY